MDKNITFSLFLKASLRPERVVWRDGKREEWGTKSLYIRRKQYPVNNTYKNKDATAYEPKFELENKISKEFQKLEEEQFLLKHNSENLKRLLIHINNLKNKKEEADDKQWKNNIQKEIRNCESIYERFIEWFRTNGHENELQIIIKDILPKEKLTAEEARPLLKRLESKNYMLTREDERIIKHRSFKTHQSRYVKKLVNGKFKDLVDKLLKEYRLLHEEFFEITKPPSDWYKKRFINSFHAHCTNRKTGMFYEKFKNYKFTKDGIDTSTGTRKKSFTITKKDL